MPPSPSASLPASPRLSSVDDGSDPVPRRHAIVAWFSSDRGFGQLRTEAGDLVYVDQRDILREGFRDLEPGQDVTWTPGHDAHGIVARNVAISEASKPAMAS
ncbi:MAG TPA: cold shock domain-containing protein [Nitriliruptoraceae bacterium]|nr:cold shock domain-containing protein [Nitriliruptoraceae bacterium]